MTDWPRILIALRGRGWHLTEIAKHCGVAYSTIARLELGIHSEPKHALGECLLKLMAETQKEERV
jgi:transcriptional regulator with XRE-family HTH domain